MSVESIIRHCAPTLAGMKVGSLFSCRYEDATAFVQEVARKNAALNRKGVYFKLLKLKNGIALVYVYRKKQLEQVLSNPELRGFLQEMGYTSFSILDCLALLRQHLQGAEFPHEIGVFLGYPLADIRAFIAHGGANYKHVGCWKVYTDEDNAKATFERYNRCTRTYFARYATGFDITQLTVAG